jgi:hypothetical protein
MRHTCALFAALSALALACGCNDPVVSTLSADTPVLDADVATPTDAGDIADTGAFIDTTASTDTAALADAAGTDVLADDATAGADTLDTAGPADAGPPPPPPFTVGEGDWAGVAVIDVTPMGFETFTDVNGDHTFNGCRHQPAGGTPECPEPYDDVNGNKDFDAAFIAGFGGLRAALTVHDPITVRALVLARGTQSLTLVSVDVVGLAVDRIAQAQDRLAALGWDKDTIIVASTHTHQGPDTRGLWGDPFAKDGTWSGAVPAYNERLTDAIVDAVTQAGQSMTKVTLTVGATRMRDESPWFNGAPFGGKSPSPRLHGLIHDIRDPVIVSDQLVALEAKGEDGATVATFVSFSAHPEIVGDESNALSADYVYYLRTALEQRRGGTSIFLPECLGGMQSTLGGFIPMTDADGNWLTQKAADGSDEPVLSNEAGFDYARSAAMHLAAAATKALDAGEAFTLDPFSVTALPIYIPVDNGSFQILFVLGIFDVDPGVPITDPALCPWWTGASMHPGCVPVTVWHVRFGPVEFLTAPGEVLPELFWGPPTDDPRYESESSDVSKRGLEAGRTSAYFPQHPAACDVVPYAECAGALEVGACNCLDYHIVPYAAKGSAHPAAASRLTGKYRFLIGMADDHLGYLIPEPDFNRAVSGLDGPTGDHYEETNSVSFRAGTLLEEAWNTLLTAGP